MPQFDDSQLRALALDPTRHARILGAPGTGKTRVLVESFARILDRPGWDEDDALVLAPNRLVASRLRREIEEAAGRALGGTPVRTPASLGFSVLSRAAALAGRAAPILSTGTVQDELIAAVVSDWLAAGDQHLAGFPREVLESPSFRAELREFWRVVDDFDVAPAALAAELGRAAAAAGGEAHTRLPERGLIDRWIGALGLVDRAVARLLSERPDEQSSSALQREAAKTVRRDGATGGGATAGGGAAGAIRIPRLVLVDDAQELGEGALALLAACADAGARIWAFGDPDIATGAFHGEPAALLTRLARELGRRSRFPQDPEQLVVLERVHRHGPVLRGLVRDLTSRIGAAGAGEQRAAEAALHTAGNAAAAGPDHAVRFAAAGSPAEQLGIIAHRLRSRKLGLAGEPVAWSEMAVICRSRTEAARAARVLAAHQVPTGIAAGGIVLREHRIVRELVRVLQHALGIAPLGPSEVLELAGGVIGGLDPVGIRRLRGALLLAERRAARAEERDAREVEELVAEAFAHPDGDPVLDSDGGRALRRIGVIAAEGARVREAGGTPRETLWAIWDRTRLAARWQDEALDARGARSDEAGRALDAVLGLFFALQRHEEQDSEQPISELLGELLASAVPEDSLAQRSRRDAVTVTTPQGVVGREFAVVAVTGVQDGAWPNLRPRGSLLGVAALERWLSGGEALPPSRRDTLHDELRLFAHSCARARGEVLVVSVSDEDHHPSPFFELGRDHRRDGLPSTRLTLRGATAQMRRRVTRDPGDELALRSLVALADAGAPGAHPDEWYGVLPPSTSAPLVDLEGDPEARVPVSPSQLERAEECPLDWVIGRLGGGASGVQAGLGTLVHHAFETVQGLDADAMLAEVMREWGKLPFESAWEGERAQHLARAMVEGLVGYLRDFDASDRELVGTEASFTVEVGRARLRGFADRLEAQTTADGATEVTVLDLKTGRSAPTRPEAEAHAQLQAYQLGIVEGAFKVEGPGEIRSGGARLLFVHPDATGAKDFVERVQQPLSAQAQQEFRRRIAEAAGVMAGGAFTARVEHHCSGRRPGNCRIHIIPAVSHA